MNDTEWDFFSQCGYFCWWQRSKDMISPIDLIKLMDVLLIQTQD